MLKFTVTIFGVSEHAERNAVQLLWRALEAEHQRHDGFPNNPLAMLIGEAKYEIPVDKPPMSGRVKQRA